MKPLAELTKTERGYELLEFQDVYSKKCSLQQSSITWDFDAKPGTHAVWLGQDERMHLNREQVESLVAHLSAWLQTGSFELNQKG